MAETYDVKVDDSVPSAVPPTALDVSHYDNDDRKEEVVVAALAASAKSLDVKEKKKKSDESLLKTLRGTKEEEHDDTEKDVDELEEELHHHHQMSPDLLEEEKRTLAAELEKIQHDKTALQKFAKKLSSRVKESNDDRDIVWMCGRFLGRTKIYIENASRMEDVSFQVQEQEMLHTFDVDRFIQRIADLFEWHKDASKRDTFVAPYFALVQSSGMGKTKLFFEFLQYVNNHNNKTANNKKKKTKKKSGKRARKALLTAKEEEEDRKMKIFDDCECVTILCSTTGVDTPSTTPTTTTSNHQQETNKSVFLENKLVLPQEREHMKTSAEINRFLNRIFLRCSTTHTHLVFVFDESQYLLEPQDGFYFRCVRWWLRMQIPFFEKRRVVAVFAGTTLKLNNLYEEPPSSSSSTGSSRGGASLYHDQGTLLYEPFHRLCTIGLFSKPFDSASSSSSSLMTSVSSSKESDLEIAIPHGRPLFALMQKKGTLTQDKLVNILNRMLLKVRLSDDWTTNLDACLSILGTRIQMGQTAMSVTSDIVSKGYAIMSSFSITNNHNSHNKGAWKSSMNCTARMSFPPDPVCARLAMGMMDEDWVLLSEHGREMMRGRSKRFWVEAMSLIFTRGLCHPNQGIHVADMGAALYLLFCADLIRKKKVHDEEDERKLRGDDDCELIETTNVDFTTTFSIPLALWMECLLDANSFYSPVDKDTSKPSPVVEPKSHYEDERQDILMEEDEQDNVEDEQDIVENEQDVLEEEQDVVEDEQDVPVGKQDVMEDEQDVAEELDSPPLEKSYANPGDDGPEYTKAEIGFIQVVCNYLRFSIGDMSKQTFLGTLYESGCAVYVHPMSHVVDLLGSIRLTNRKSELHFVPLLVSVSTVHKKEHEHDALEEMKTLLDQAKTFGLCIKLIFAGPGQRVTKKMANLLTVDDAEMLLQGQTVSKVLVVPRNDPFGIVTNLLQTATLDGPPSECEVYSSHYFLQLTQKPDTRLVQTNATAGLRKYIDGMHEALWNAKAPPPVARAPSAARAPFTPSAARAPSAAGATAAERVVTRVSSAAGATAAARVTTRASSAAGATAAASSSSVVSAPSAARATRASAAAIAPSTASVPSAARALLTAAVASSAEQAPSALDDYGRKRKRDKIREKEHHISHI